MNNDEADDDQDWLDLLAGRSVPHADVSTRQQAGALRAALLKQQPMVPTGAPSAADERAERLLHRARLAGILNSHQAKPSRHTPAANRWPYALAASVGLFGVLLLLQQQQGAQDDPIWAHQQMRGGSLQQRSSATPELDRQALLEELRSAGFDAHPYERLGRLGIDVDLPVPIPARQAEALKGLGLQAVQGPSLQIEFIKPATDRSQVLPPLANPNSSASSP